MQISRNRTLLRWKETAATFRTSRTIAETIYALVWNQGLADQELIVVGDGASWIRSIRDPYFPTARSLLDWWHLKERVHRDLQKMLPATQRTKRCKSMVRSLWRGTWQAALGELAAIRPTTSRAEEAKGLLEGYIKQNAEGIVDYRAQQERGRLISTSIVEKTGDLLIARRYKHQGMAWGRQGANAVALVRTLIINHRWEQYCQRRRAA